MPTKKKTTRPRRPRTRLSEQRKARFLKELAAHGIAVEAAKAASPHSKDGALRTFEDERKRSPEFAEQWAAALAEAAATCERELVRRAQEGWLERPIIDKDGRVVGHVQRFSDRLLELRIKALNPAYREKSQLDVNASATLDANVKVDLEATIAQLDEEGQHALRIVLMQTLAARGELTDNDRLIAADHAARREQSRALAARATANATERRIAPPPIIDVQAQEVSAPAQEPEPPLGHQPTVPEPEPAAAGPEPAPEPARVLPFVAPRILR